MAGNTPHPTPVPPRYGTIAFLTDYGLQDGYVAACHGVIARIAPGVRVVDVTHLVPAQDVRGGATVLARTAPYLPPAVHLAVVDPGVGTERRAVVVAAGEHLLVGPDNGLLLPAAAALGGADAAWEITNPQLTLERVSATFHGRDVFAPVAAHLATGVEPERVGPALAPAELVPAPTALARVIALPDGLLAEGEVVTVDRFGTAQTALLPTHLVEAGLVGAHAVTVHLPDGSPLLVHRGATFADVPPGEPVLLVDSDGHLALAVNQGDAAARYGIRPGDQLRISALR